MTREEAIARLEANRGAFVFKETNEALDMAIEALRNCSEKPNGSLISKEDVKWQIQEWIAELNEAIDMLDSIPSAEPLVLTCDGCRHVGTYDTDFPCSGCIRREKDYYEQER